VGASAIAGRGRRVCGVFADGDLRRLVEAGVGLAQSACRQDIMRHARH
jgi:hypothetical protein